MPKYYDPITTEKLEFNDETIVYLIKTTDAFCIKAISTGLDQLMKDPTTNAKQYWLVDTKKLYAEQLNHELLFINNELTTSPLTAQQVKELLHIDTQMLQPTNFDPNKAVQDQLRLEYAEAMVANINLVPFQVRAHFYELAIALGNSDAMCYRALMHQNGQGGDVDYDAAIALYEQAIALGHSYSMCNRALMYQNGQGGAVNLNTAIELYDRAIALGNSDAMFNRALMHQNGQGGDVNYQTAIALYEQAIALGDTDAMIACAGLHVSGLAGSVNYPKALELYKKAKELIHDPEVKDGLEQEINGIQTKIDELPKKHSYNLRSRSRLFTSDKPENEGPKSKRPRPGG